MIAINKKEVKLWSST